MIFNHFIETVDLALAKERTRINNALPYRIPKGFTPWLSLASVAALSIASQDSPDLDRATQLHCGLWDVWVRHRAPMYLLTADMLRRFSDTDCDGLAGVLPTDWVPPLPIFLINLPLNALQTPTGDHIAFLLVALSHPDIPNIVKSEYPRQISFATVDTGGSVWLSGTGIGPDQRFVREDTQLGKDAVSDAESAWLWELTALSLQIAIAMTYSPEIFSESSEMVNQKPGRKGNQARPQKHIFPRWIKSADKPATKAHTTGTGTGTSKRTHWRKGHWRNQACGEGNSQRKLIWVRPFLVN